jgi:hypothetical protein
MLTVAELIALLQAFPSDLPIGRIGYYGEFYDLDKHDFHQTKSMYEKPWPDRGYSEPFECVAIDPPSIGEEPD